MTISAEMENQSSGDGVEMDPRGILGELERIRNVIDDARRVIEPAQETADDQPDVSPLPDDAPFDVPLIEDDLSFVLDRLEEGNAVTVEILAEDELHPDVRREQEESLELGLSAVAEVASLVARAGGSNSSLR
ncbi:hypothetical protein ACIQLK_06995 [Microbacterium sp. NPDC091382]|uniref:hypothetical protein n=1 Tax=Microbacterium sp. NPDC091382 TaxID=3364210 RepID=UPI003824ECA8